jgi:hypothetical protein
MATTEPSVIHTHGYPCVIVPKEALWSFVEYLAVRRLPAEFSYLGDDFRALFPHLSPQAAEQLLSDWQAYQLTSEDTPTHIH